MRDGGSYLIPFILVTSLFFLWGFAHSILDVLNKHFQDVLVISKGRSGLVQAVVYGGYFLMALPAGKIMERFGYRVGVVVGLLLYGIGALMFIPGGRLMSFEFFLLSLFVIGCGLTCLETAANPYVTVLGEKESAARRLNLAQSFNGLGAFVSAMFLSKMILSGHHYTRETLPADYAGGWEAYIQFETDSMKQPYLMLALLLLVIAVVFVICRLPKIPEEENKQNKTGKLINPKVLKRSHLRWGVICQFFYNGGQTAINSLFLVYCCLYVGIPENEATTYFGIYMLAFLLGRWIGTGLMGRFKPQNMLLLYAVMNVLLCVVIMCFGGYVGLYAMIGVSFFMSIMYPTQFSLALTDLGEDTKSGSAFLVMAIIGNACLPQLTAYFMNSHPESYAMAYVIPLICFIFCAFYGWKGYKVVD